MLRWAAGGTFVLTLISIGLSLEHARWKELHSEWAIWLVIAQGLGLFGLWRCFGRPATPHVAISLTILNSWLLALAGLYHFGMFDYSQAVAADVVLRAALVGLWTLALLGLPWIVYRIWQGRLPHRSAFCWGIGWFSILTLYITVELFNSAQLDGEKIDVVTAKRLLCAGMRSFGSTPPAG